MCNASNGGVGLSRSQPPSSARRLQWNTESPDCGGGRVREREGLMNFLPSASDRQTEGGSAAMITRRSNETSPFLEGDGDRVKGIPLKGTEATNQ